MLEKAPCVYNTNGHTSWIAPLQFQPIDDGEGRLGSPPLSAGDLPADLMLFDWSLAVRGIRGALAVGAGRVPDELRKAGSKRIVVGPETLVADIHLA